jgi:transcriptional regulator with XRE-family HTH domain
MIERDENALGAYLRDRRSKLNPKAFGFDGARRRTPGLRREEVAQRANISATWYTWLEQGRGGAPSADVLERIAEALALAPVEREHLFLLAQNRPPETRYTPAKSVSPRLQRLLDSFELSPAFVKTAVWDVIAWNRAATAVLGDYERMPLDERNIMRRIFYTAALRTTLADWEHDARFLVAAFRADVARAGASSQVAELIDELTRRSDDFRRMWNDNDVGAYGEGTKYMNHAVVGRIALEYSSFSVNGEPDLDMVIFNPATPQDADRIRSLLR